MKEGLVRPSMAKVKVVPTEHGEQGGVRLTVKFMVKGSTVALHGTFVPTEHAIDAVLYAACGKMTCILLLLVKATPKVDVTVILYVDST